MSTPRPDLPPAPGPDGLEAFVADVAARHDRCAWLDGGGARAWSGRRSVVAWLDDDDVSLSFHAARGEVVRHRGGRAEVVGDDVFAVLGAELAGGPSTASWFGWFGYAARTDLTARPAGDDDVPDAVWLRPSHVRVVDHPAGSALLPPPPPQPAAAGAVRRSAVPDAYAAAFARVQEHLHAGDTYEVNLTERLRVASDLDPVEAYRRLRALNPAPYAGFLQHRVEGAAGWLLSSSPERYALLTPGTDGRRLLETRPIKGTLPRGASADDDEAARDRLAADPRFRAENLMIVDLLRHDLATVCEPGTVAVPDLMRVEPYTSVHQLVSTVRGELRPDVPTVAALRALFPAGSMTGAPKRRTMEVIDAVEATPRGAYAGAFGWVAADGRADLGVVIRSLTTTAAGHYDLGVGGGVTVMSDVATEFAEARLKGERLLRVFD